ncbi:hypothetical protein BSZ14_11875 [Sphingomonas sp. Sph1(2015)]|jgi:hypothetical protein|uniref:hypothetical protein n=1 Tax=Sphingomonas sp. Sph1(2015) TaxID=1628084 RepID=UPI000978C66B|nr:hypothetical protein [Sphingomonas sp. Sph1(2015)]OMJ31707.1 hypothetical protein BSZ14_11875 [Sphingomonas sp. Sph1(2015)]
MPARFIVQHREVGMLCIYLKPSDKIGPRRFWGARPLYRKLIRTAKADGIINAIAQHRCQRRRIDRAVPVRGLAGINRIQSVQELTL